MYLAEISDTRFGKRIYDYSINEMKYISVRKSKRHSYKQAHCKSNKDFEPTKNYNLISNFPRFSLLKKLIDAFSAVSTSIRVTPYRGL